MGYLTGAVTLPVWTDKISGDVYPANGDDTYRLVTAEPLDVCASISARNATLFSLSWKIVPAITVENTVIFKAPEKFPRKS